MCTYALACQRRVKLRRPGEACICVSLCISLDACAVVGMQRNVCFTPHVASGADSDTSGVYLAQHILGNIVGDLAQYSDAGVPVDLPGVGLVYLHPWLFGTAGDLVEHRDVFAVKRNSCPICVHVSDALPSVLRTGSHRAAALEAGCADACGYLDWVKGGNVCHAITVY
jgi:hypothetical protein